MHLTSGYTAAAQLQGLLLRTMQAVCLQAAQLTPLQELTLLKS